VQTSATPGNTAIQPAEQKLAWLETLKRGAPLLIVIIVLAAFARTLDFGLYLDDHHHARPWTLPEVLGTFAGPFDPLGIEPPYFRPLVVVTFALDWSIWGFNAWGYHLTNVLLHTIASLLVYFFLRRIKLSWLVALTGALFFAIIPANAATAIYISERSDAMVAIFSLCGLLSLDNYQRDGNARWLVALNAMVVSAIGCKEIGVTLPFLAIFFWMYLVVTSTLNLENNTVKRTEIRKYWLFTAHQIWQTLTTGQRLKQLARVAAMPLALLALYMAYRVLVLPTGLVSSRYSATTSPLRGFASALFWTFKAVPWEVPSLTLPVLAAAIGLALMVRPWSAGWRIVLLGVGWVAIACMPLAYLGQVEPRLLYLPEVGHSIMLAGLAFILSDFVRLALERRHPRQLTGAIAVCLVVLALFGTTTISFFKAQDEFQPLGYKMLRADYEIHTDLRYRHLYPEVYIKEIEQKLQQAGMLP
jgi:hypothetical protein